jgi:glycosyltransferase involved in cell wall biosynthesis
MHKLPIHFFTIVLNGNPFIQYHEKIFSELNIPWKWHIVEGVASLINDTAWSLENGGQITSSIHNHGISNDGTSTYLDELVERFPENIILYRKPKGIFWNGKKEMVGAPLINIKENCLLWQIDADELWQLSQIKSVYELFEKFPDKTAAYYWCWYFVGPNKIISTRYGYAQNPNQEWLRTWKFNPGDYWDAHEPPLLMRDISMSQKDSIVVNVAQMNPFSHDDTENVGAVFQHYAYATPEQIKFKEIYYGYKEAYGNWLRLQDTPNSSLLKNFFDWSDDVAIQDNADNYPFTPLATYNSQLNKWEFEAGQRLQNKIKLLKPVIVIDGVFWQYSSSGIARVWQSIFEEWVKSGFANHVILLDRQGTAPRISGVHYWSIPKYDKLFSSQDSQLLENICQYFEADIFISTYYTTPIQTRSFFFGYDMIPEMLGMPLLDLTWIEKKLSIFHADHHSMISDSSCRDLVKIYPHLSPEKIHTLKPAAALAFYKPSKLELHAFLEKYKLKQHSYILIVGERVGYYGYKNAIAAFKAIGTLKEVNLSILCVGGHEFVEQELAREATNVHIQRVALSDDELRCAYAGAYCFIYPSLYEGFGLPIIEAMKCGTPVLTYNNSSIGEVAENAAIYVSGLSSTEFGIKISDLQVGSKIRADYIQRGFSQAEKYSFKKMGDEFSEILLKVSLSRKNPEAVEKNIKILEELRTTLRNEVRLSIQMQSLYEELLTCEPIKVPQHPHPELLSTKELLKLTLLRCLYLPYRVIRRIYLKNKNI